MTGKGRRLIISDAMTESGPVRGALWMFKADGKGKKRKIESKSKEVSGEKKRRKLDSESTEKKEDTVDGGENDSEIAEGIPFEEDYHDSMDGESYKCYFEKSICQIYRNTRLSWLIMHLTIQKIWKITPLASGESNNLLIGLQKRHNIPGLGVKSWALDISQIWKREIPR